MKEVFLTDLTAEDLIRLIDEGERFYVRTNKSNILPEPHPTAERDAFWFEEAPRASKPLRETLNKQKDSGTN